MAVFTGKRFFYSIVGLFSAGKIITVFLLDCGFFNWMAVFFTGKRIFLLDCGFSGLGKSSRFFYGNALEKKRIAGIASPSFQSHCFADAVGNGDDHSRNAHCVRVCAVALRDGVDCNAQRERATRQYGPAKSHQD